MTFLFLYKPRNCLKTRDFCVILYAEFEIYLREDKHVESVQRGIYLHLYTEYHARGLAEAFGVAGYHRFLYRAGKHKAVSYTHLTLPTKA